MKIAIIGSGNIGSALGNGWLKTGHQVIYGVRDPQSPKTQKMQALISTAITTIQQAVEKAEVVVLTTPPEAVLEIIPQLGDMKGKTIIDATNSVRTRPDPYPTAFDAIKALTKAIDVVKCFNTTGFENMQNPVYGSNGAEVRLDMFAAGDSKKAKGIAEQLSKDIGFENCYDFGGDDKVELLEKFALSWINLAIMQGQGRGIAFKVIRR